MTVARISGFGNVLQETAHLRLWDDGRVDFKPLGHPVYVPNPEPEHLGYIGWRKTEAQIMDRNAGLGVDVDLHGEYLQLEEAFDDARDFAEEIAASDGGDYRDGIAGVATR